jgi:hypothetical protein
MRCGFLGLAAALGGMLLAGCHHSATLACEDTQRYASAESVQPVQIPDDLSPPSETEALRLPPVVPANGPAPTRPCLESPPAFSEQIQLGRATDAAQPAAGAAPKSGRRERRQQRRHADKTK